MLATQKKILRNGHRADPIPFGSPQRVWPARSSIATPFQYWREEDSRPALLKNRNYCRKCKQKAIIGQAPSFWEEPAADEENQLFCCDCFHPITAEEHAISPGGSHHHTFFNPAGITYELRCFQHAPGVTPYHPSSNEFSWFAGYSWQIVHCSVCQSHLGWRYIQATGSHVFFGLIASKLQKNRNTGNRLS